MVGTSLTVLLALSTLATIAVAQSTQESSRPLEYASVSAALSSLRVKPGVTFSKNDNWLIAKETNNAMWSFTPATHPAHPSVGRRQIVEQNGRFFIETRILCEAPKAACDQLNADYQTLDRRMNEAIRAGK